ncbi:hypothetical protein [Variovorax sp. GT1P44]|uniref:hypothetical protein n=1 Tax=Variovorax sp. GT1P44 TaxID=3443742 RepID=UPI003F48CACF
MSALSFWDALTREGGDLGVIFAQIERRDAEALAELTIGLRILSLLLTLSGSALALFFVSPEESLATDPSLLDDPLLRFHHAYVSHFPIVAITLLIANLLIIGGLLYAQIRTGWPRNLVREFGLGNGTTKSMESWRSIFLERLEDSTHTAERIEKIIFLGATLVIIIIPVQLAVVAALVTIFRKAMA